jgi:hypothetical protein
LDGKGTLSDWGLQDWTSETRGALRKGKPARVRVTLPWGIKEPLDFWNEILQESFFDGDLTIYIDEIYAIAEPQKKPPEALWACYTRGRELGVGVWGVSQRPVWVPLFCLSEADWFFAFRLQLEEDRKKVAAFMGPQVLPPIQDKHGFFHMGAEDDDPIYIKRYVDKKQVENVTPIKKPDR